MTVLKIHMLKVIRNLLLVVCKVIYTQASAPLLCYDCMVQACLQVCVGWFPDVTTYIYTYTTLGHVAWVGCWE